MNRVRAPLSLKEEAEHLAARRALKSLIRFKLDVHEKQHGQRKGIAAALSAVEPIAEFLIIETGTADAFELLEECVAELRQRAQSRLAGQGKGAAK